MKKDRCGFIFISLDVYLYIFSPYNKFQNWLWTDNTPMNYTLFNEDLWANGEPNAPIRSNCAIQYPWEHWGDAECDNENDKYGFFCGELSKLFFFQSVSSGK